METNKTTKYLPYGKKMRCHNFYVEKVGRALNKADMKRLRAEMMPNMPKGYKGSQRTSMPVIRVSDLQGMWRIEYAVSATMFHIFDAFEWAFINGEYVITDETCYRLLTMLYCDTTIVGDEEYIGDRVKALNAFTARVKAHDVSDEEDEKIVESLKALNIVDNGDEDGEESQQ